jgi:hypothetical protein
VRWKLTSKDWARSDTGHGICKSTSGRYAAWKEWRFLGFADSKEQAIKMCAEDHVKTGK